jgi:hypothetical protein
MPDFKDILKRIDEAIARFNKKIPGIQKNVLDGIIEELRKLDLKDSKIKPTVANLRLIGRIKNKLQNLILTDDYIDEVKEFAKAFNDITKLQNEYWKQAERTFKPKTLLKEIKKQSIEDTVNKLTEAGIGVNIENSITDILRTNITAGGSYRSLEAQLRELLTNTKKSDGAILKYTKQISVDSINTFNAQYTQTVSNDLGFEWYAWQGSELQTSRPFCQSMVEERRYFHISEVPALLRAEDMYYTDNKDGERKKVPIYKKTGLPHGFIEGTNPGNFFVRRGGHFCGHQARPVSASLVPKEVKERVLATAAFRAWKSRQ